MNKFVDNLDKLLALVPYLIMSGSLSIYFLPLFIIFPVIFSKITEWITDIFYKDYTYDIYEFNEKGNVNKFYDYVTFILKKHDMLKQIKKMECCEHGINYSKKTSNEKHNIIYYKDIPVLNPMNNKKIKFVHNDIEIYIIPQVIADLSAKHNKKRMYYRLTSSKYDNIKKFMDYINLIQHEYVDKFSSKKQSNFHHFDIIDKKWLSLPININKTFDTIFLDNNLKSKIINDIDNFVNNKKEYERLGLPRKLGYLLYGTPGNGKSSMIYAIAKKYNKSIFKINLSVTKSDFMKQICNIQQGSIVIFEDIDTCQISHTRNQNYVICNNSNDNNSNDNNDFIKNDQKLNQLQLGDILEILDGYCYLNECIVIMTTNYVDKLDNALIRSGRMDHKINFANVNNDQITQIIKYYCNENVNPDLIKQINISVSELINTIIIPNLNNYSYIHNYLFN